MTARRFLSLLFLLATPLFSQVAVTLNTVPEGLLISVDGQAAQVSPRTVHWNAGTTHTISALSPQGDASTRYLFTGWSDGGTATHAITVPPSTATYTASFQVQHRLTRVGIPMIAGALVAVPPSADGFYNAGSSVALSASPIAGFYFAGFGGDLSGLTNPQPVVMNQPRSVAAAFQLVAGQSDDTPLLPRMAFRDVWGGIQAHIYGNAQLSVAGGVFAGDPQVVVAPGGETYIVAVDTYKALWVNTLRASDQQFAGWRNAGGRVQGVPAVALAPNGTVYIAIRDDFNGYWLTSYTSATGLGTWSFLGGQFSTDPALAINANGEIYLVGKDNWSALWTGRFVSGSGFQGWRSGGGILQGKPSVTAGTDNIIYVAVRDPWNGVYLGRISGGVFLGWSGGGGVLGADPKIVTKGDGTVAVVICDAWGTIHSRSYTEGSSGGWLNWVSTGGRAQYFAPAVASGILYLAVTNLSGDLAWYNGKTNQWTVLGYRNLAAGEIGAGPR